MAASYMSETLGFNRLNQYPSVLIYDFTFYSLLVMKKAELVAQAYFITILTHFSPMFHFCTP